MTTANCEIERVRFRWVPVEGNATMIQQVLRLLIAN